MPSGAWLPVDPTLAQGGRDAAEFHFGSLDNRRVALCRTHDIDVGSARGSHRQRDSLQQGAGWWQGQNLHESSALPEVRFRVVGEEVEPQA